MQSVNSTATANTTVCNGVRPHKPLLGAGVGAGVAGGGGAGVSGAGAEVGASVGEGVSVGAGVPNVTLGPTKGRYGTVG